MQLLLQWHALLMTMHSPLQAAILLHGNSVIRRTANSCVVVQCLSSDSPAYACVQRTLQAQALTMYITRLGQRSAHCGPEHGRKQPQVRCTPLHVCDASGLQPVLTSGLDDALRSGKGAALKPLPCMQLEV